MRRRWIPIAAAAGSAVVVALLGASATDISGWYFNLRKSPLTPPDWAFGPAWTVIYALTALSGVIAWRLAGSVVRRRMVVLFAANALLNVMWSELFFMFQRPDWALIEVVPFWLSILLLIAVLRPVSSRASWLLVPYLAWVAFAGWLNVEIVRLNGPFGRT